MLRHYRRGLLWLLPVLFGLVFVIQQAVQRALQIVQQIEQGTLPADVQTITQMVTASSASEGPLLNLVVWVIVGCWLLASIDAYRLGTREDGIDKATPRDE